MTRPAAVQARDLAALVVGVELLGSGGGGAAATFARVLRRRLRGDRIDLHGPDELADTIVVPVGVVGSTNVFLEKLPGGAELAGAVQAICRWVGVRADAVMSLEAGGLNGIAGLVASVDLGLPFLDADLMGRAFPRLDQFSWAVEGLPIAPCALCDAGSQVVVVDTSSPAGVERIVRTFLSQTGGWAALALPPVPVSTAVAAAVQGSTARALALGRAHAGLGETPPQRAVEAALAGRVLAAGRVVEVNRYGGVGGFGRGSVTVIDTRSESVVRVECENEYLLALVDGCPEVGTPDVLCLLDRRSGRPLAVDRVRAGDEVFVLALPGPVWWTETPRRRTAVSPDAFGLSLETAPLAAWS